VPWEVNEILWNIRFAAFAVREKCKAGAFIFPYRGPHSGSEPEGLKGGKPDGRKETVLKDDIAFELPKSMNFPGSNAILSPG
jgi:hypothetical protein